MKKLVFVSGVARSGTSALVNVLNKNPGFLIGMERYFFLIKREEITLEHFRGQRFLAVEEGDTHGKGLAMEDPKKALRNATFIGDKFPLLFEHFDYMLDAFPEARHIYIVRNPLSVVESYDARLRDKSDKWRKSWQVGLNEWNTSVQSVMKLSAEQLAKFYFVSYESFFESTGEMNALFSHFDLGEVRNEHLKPFCQKFRELNENPVKRRDDIRQYVARHADWQSYRALLQRIEEQKV
ncbi:sulfotransferase family protein [Shimia sagamensis]|uniref:Sulfotransferase family protein n=1 Tax=Shimia sagamensis TaxID=1566352 RepID=A0ABY1NBJ3_9RHOB|nr:sulfotransferase [Shimia sagamensis]SMP05559.1 Sulfotransferase family protein [Shimia sagamensis]